MRAEDKPRYVKQLRGIIKTSNFKALLSDPDDIRAVSEIHRAIAIFKNFSFNDGEKLENLFKDFQKWARAGERKVHIKNCLNDVVQFISQKTEEMNVYHIEPEPKYDAEVIKKRLKDKDLWAQSKQIGEEEHIFIGERADKTGSKVHLVVGKTGELRIDPSDKPPGDILKRVTALTMRSGKKITSTKSTLEFGDEDSEVAKTPLLDVSFAGRTGGSKGHFESFKIKNIGDEAAIDCRWGIRGFAYEWRPQGEPLFTLTSGQDKEVTYQISGKKLFVELVPELNIIMECKNSKGEGFFIRREIEQVRVKSGSFYNLELRSFHPPVELVNDGVEFISGPTVNGDRVEGEFEITSDKKTEIATIGISRTLLSTWEFIEDPDFIKQALLELGYRKVRKMIKNGGVEDYIFVSTEYPQEYQNGFEGYQRLRDAI